MKENQTESKIKVFDMTLILTTIICLLPIIFGIIKWNDLPSQIAIHWGLNGEPDSYGPKFLAVVILPVILAVINFIAQLTTNIQISRGILTGKKFSNIAKWIIPVISLTVNVTIYAVALGIALNISTVVGLLVGFVFVVLGNYIPKTGYTSSFRFGLNFKDSDEIYEKVKRPLGFTQVLLGLFILAFSFTSFGNYIILGAIAILLIVYLILHLIYRRK